MSAMSNSHRKTPKRGVTSAASDKAFKTLEHRRERRAVKESVKAGEDTLHSKTYGNPWRGDKDGKIFIKDPTPKDLRK